MGASCIESDFFKIPTSVSSACATDNEIAPRNRMVCLRPYDRDIVHGLFAERGGVAQLVEQRTHKPRVPRSIRGTATIYAADS